MLYAPDYVINAGGIVAVTLEYLAREQGQHCSIDEVYAAAGADPAAA